MAYTKQNWTDGVSVANATRLSYIEEGIRQAAETADQALVGATGTVTAPRLGPIRVASSQAPTAVKNQAHYIAPGTNDQNVINQAINQAARAADVTGGTGAGKVELIGGDFFVGNDNTGVILMQTGVWVQGAGKGMLIQPMYSSYTGLGVFMLADASSCHLKVSDLSIGKPNSVIGRCSGFNFQGDGASGTSGIATGNDRFNTIENVNVYKPQGYGITCTGTGGGVRTMQINNCVIWDCTLSGINISGSSDSHIVNCNVQSGSGGPGFNIGGGNSKVLHCKSYYADGSTDGFVVSSSRCEVIGCSAQDNARWGFNISSNDATVTGCVADSNGRIDTTGGGFLISGDGIYSGINCFDRAQSANQQTRGISLSGSPQVNLTGRVSVPSGSNHVVGSAGANSFVRVVRSGTTIFSVG